MSELAGLWVFASFGVAVYGALTLPTWLFASMNRSTLWSLRDRVFDAQRHGLLPDRPEVERFIGQLEQHIVLLPTISALQLWWFTRHVELKAKGSPFDALTHADPESQQYFALLQDELGRIILRHYLVGSWSGLLMVSPRRLRDLKAVLSRRSDLDDWCQTRLGQGGSPEHWRDHEVVVEVELVVPHLRKRREKDLLAAAG